MLEAFCLREEIVADASKILAFNINNMRAREINEVFKRVGIKDFCSAAGRNTAMIEFFGAATPDISHGKFLGQIEEFYENRNDVAHSIGSLRGTGPIQVSRYLDFFDCTAQVFANELNSLLPID